MIGLACCTITLAQGSYAPLLLAAMTCAALASAFLAIPFVRGPAGWRVAAVVLALPVLFIVSDFLRRAPYIFGGG